ncbi:hypothetical protein QR680_017555 [Steinernema hermaphroditum]|uniref:Endonuclease-reverse transcriptase n=1 Tax=Steinernema hermaphroditum TaxID=289476 RepID=A0AA39HF04_9BILA|nr:hypothetical protein QR680_017555 [Steinernema hermaphroditum]
MPADTGKARRSPERVEALGVARLGSLEVCVLPVPDFGPRVPDQEFLTSKTVQMRWKRRLHDQCILPAMLYGCETWALTQTAQRKLAAGQRRMQRRVVGVRLLDKKSNDWLRGVTKFTDVVEAAKKRKWNYAWKLANESPEKWSRELEEWRPPVTRPLGRPRTRWRDDFVKKLGTTRWQQRAREELRPEWANNGV